MGEKERLTDLYARLYELEGELAEHTRSAKKRRTEICDEITSIQSSIDLFRDGLDEDQIKLAETIVTVSSVERGGEDWKSCIEDAIKQFTTGEPLRTMYGDLWLVAFGTKDYDRWHGQRCDCEYGWRPRHGSICFAVALTHDARQRKQADLSADEVEACLYYLTNIERIQAARNQAASEVQ